MTTERTKRKLSGILSADVQGYSRLMEDDEKATVDTITKYREIISSIIRKYNGRVVDSPGDNLLAEFGSVTDATEASVDIQTELKSKNADLPDNRKMEFRIGISLGDVIEDGDRIYGVGVNIAARLQSLAEGGGICISGTVYDQVENKLAVQFENLGEHKVKNIQKPIRVFRVLFGQEVTSRESNMVRTQEKPSIAVLPFVNLSDDPEQEYFSDGLTEDLITDLSKVSGLFVIARNSVFTYKGKTVRVDKVGQDLGVRYIVEGSVRKVKDRVRITAQLVDSKTGGHIWAERYDRDLEDIFSLQDEVTQKIVEALEVTLTVKEQQQLRAIPTDNLEAYDFYLKGSAYFSRTTKDAIAQARQMYQKAIDLDPDYADAYAALGVSYWVEWIWQFTQDSNVLIQANELIQKALALDDASPSAYMVLGFLQALKKNYAQALESVRKGIALDPNNPDAYLLMGFFLTVSGKAEEAITHIKKAMRLNPHYPFIYAFRLGMAYHFTNRYDEAISEYKKSITLNPDFIPVHINLAALYSELGQKESAKAEVAEILRLSPDFSSDALKERFSFINQDTLTRLIEALRKAGLP